MDTFRPRSADRTTEDELRGARAARSGQRAGPGVIGRVSLAEMDFRRWPPADRGPALLDVIKAPADFGYLSPRILNRTWRTRARAWVPAGPLRLGHRPRARSGPPARRDHRASAAADHGCSPRPGRPGDLAGPRPTLPFLTVPWRPRPGHHPGPDGFFERRPGRPSTLDGNRRGVQAGRVTLLNPLQPVQPVGPGCTGGNELTAPRRGGRGPNGGRVFRRRDPRPAAY